MCAAALVSDAHLPQGMVLHAAGDCFQELLMRMLMAALPYASICPPCRPYAEKYAADEGAFFKDYTQSHLKLR